MAQSHVPTRLNTKDPATNAALNDLYDKLQQIQSTPVSAPVTTTTTPPVAQTVVSIQGASGQAAGPQFADIPNLTAIPSNNPTQGLPYTQEGLPVIVSLSPTIPGPIYRYSDTAFVWTRETCPVLFDTHANRVANYLPANYPIAVFVETDTLLTLESTGAAWVTLSGTVRDTHANRLANWPSVQFSVNTQFYETDRTVTYSVQNASGTVTVAGGVNVSWTAGNHFINTGSGFTAAQWPSGTPIVIAGITYSVSVVNSATSLTLASAATNGAGQAYSVASGRWVYLSGQYSAALASLPADLGEADSTLVSSNVTQGFLFYENAVYAHQLQWNVSAWQRGPDDKEHSDSFHEFGSAPTDLGWQICDGSAGVTFLKYDGTTGTRTVPDLSTAAYAKSTKATYSASLSTPVVPTFAGTPATPAGTVSTPTFTGTPLTPAGSVGSTFTGTPQTFTTTAATPVGVVNAFTGPNPYTPAGSVSSTFTGTPGTPAGSISTPTFSGTPATPAGTISLPGDPVENLSFIKFYRR